MDSFFLLLLNASFPISQLPEWRSHLSKDAVTYPSWIALVLFFSRFPRQSSHIVLMEAITPLVLHDCVSHENCMGQAAATIWTVPEKILCFGDEWMLEVLRRRSNDHVKASVIHVSKLTAAGVSLAGDWGSLPLQVVEKTVFSFLCIEYLTLSLTLWGLPKMYQFLTYKTNSTIPQSTKQERNLRRHNGFL